MNTVLIAGANRGLGLEFVRQYVADDWEVIAGCREPAAATELTALSAASDGRVRVHAVDVADGASVARFHDAVGATAIDVLIAGAGVFGGQAQDFGSVDFDAWEQALRVNTVGPVRVAQAFAAELRATAGAKLVAITSQLGSIEASHGGMIAYRSSKAALNAAWKSVGLALAGQGVGTLLLHPGWVKTDMGGANAPLTPAVSVAGMRRVDRRRPAFGLRRLQGFRRSRTALVRRLVKRVQVYLAATTR